VLVLVLVPVPVVPVPLIVQDAAVTTKEDARLTVARLAAETAIGLRAAIVLRPHCLSLPEDTRP